MNFINKSLFALDSDYSEDMNGVIYALGIPSKSIDVTDAILKDTYKPFLMYFKGFKNLNEPFDFDTSEVHAFFKAPKDNTSDKKSFFVRKEAVGAKPYSTICIAVPINKSVRGIKCNNCTIIKCRVHTTHNAFSHGVTRSQTFDWYPNEKPTDTNTEYNRVLYMIVNVEHDAVDPSIEICTTSFNKKALNIPGSTIKIRNRYTTISFSDMMPDIMYDCLSQNFYPTDKVNYHDQTFSVNHEMAEAILAEMKLPVARFINETIR